MSGFARAGLRPALPAERHPFISQRSLVTIFFMGHAAMLINEGLPNLCVSQLRNEDLSDRCVAILGMAFKADSDDCRDSLSYKLKKLLESKHAKCCALILRSPIRPLFLSKKHWTGRHHHSGGAALGVP